MANDRVEVLRIVPGRLYRSHALRLVHRDGGVVVEDIAEGLFCVVRLAFHGMTRQDLVVCRGLEGMDLDRWLVFTPAQFAIAFRPEPEAESPAGIVETAPEAPAAMPSRMGADWSEEALALIGKGV